MLLVPFRVYLKGIRSIIPLTYRRSLNLGLSGVVHNTPLLRGHAGTGGVVQFVCLVVFQS